MKAKDKAAAIKQAQENLAAAKAIVAAFGVAFENVVHTAEDFGPISDAWNAAHDMVSALEGAEHRIEMDDNFDRIVASGQYESYKLAANNID